MDLWSVMGIISILCAFYDENRRRSKLPDIVRVLWNSTYIRHVPLSKQKKLESYTVIDYGRSSLYYERKTTSTKYYARSMSHYEHNILKFQNYPFKHLTQFPLSIKARIGTFPSHFPQILLFQNSNLLCVGFSLCLTRLTCSKLQRNYNKHKEKCPGICCIHLNRFKTT